jgi:hypothetical protein
MASLIAWLDASSEEQQQMREIIRLFTDRESVDELGLGQIRDALSDGLFPGTSTLHTRARYLLFIPWLFQQASQARDPKMAADRAERKLINSLRGTDDFAGLLGMNVGAGLRTLPSTIYWSALRRHGILTDPNLTIETALEYDGRSLGIDELDDSVSARSQAWSTTMPKRPEGFPESIPDGFRMRREEAEWLRDRILYSSPDTLLAHLTIDQPLEESTAPWESAAALRATGEAATLLAHARAFSAIMHGAQLLYNLMLAEQYEECGFDRVDTEKLAYSDRMEEWAEKLGGHIDVEAWDLESLLVRVETIRGMPVHPNSKGFVSSWLKLIRESDPATIVDSNYARTLIKNRESNNKGKQARLNNPRRLQNWGGLSGADALTFRWRNVRTLLGDIHDGLERKDA